MSKSRKSVKTPQKKKKFVVWLHNRTDERDDEWLTVYASSKEDVQAMELSYQEHRFYLGDVYTATEFRERMGFGA